MREREVLKQTHTTKVDEILVCLLPPSIRLELFTHRIGVGFIV